MNIAYVTADAYVPVFGSRASSVHVQEILRAMSRRNFAVNVFAAACGGAVTNEFASLKFDSIAPRQRSGRGAEKAALAVNNSLRELLAERHSDNPFNFVYERYSVWSYAAMEFAREHDIPAVLEVNAPILEELTARHLLVNRGAAEDATMRAFRAASVITTVSRQLGHILETHPSTRGKVQVIPNAADASRFSSATPSLEKNPDEFVIGFAGELHPAQGISCLLAAFQLVADALPHARLVIVGEGNEREPLERDVAARSLQNHVRFLGGVPPHAMPGMMASFDAAVAPYPQLAGFYSSPIKVFEYMAAGLPIVASRIGQLEEVLTHNRTAMLVTPGDRENLAETLYDLEQDPNKRQQLGLAAQARANAAHTWDGALDEVLRVAGAGVLAAA